MPTRFAILLLAVAALAQSPREFVTVDAQAIALTHVRVIDGTGATARSNQTLLVAGGRIQAVGPDLPIPPGARVIDLPGRTVIPGLVGMHEHMFYPSGLGIPVYTEHAFSFPRFYLASGVTTARTAGTLEAQTDLQTKRWIDEGKIPGPKFHITAGYLEGPGTFTPQMLELRNPEDAVAFVQYWASQGATSFKAYMHITRAQLKAAIDAAHERRLKVTGHLCSVGFREAATLGIDNLEHGVIVDGELAPGKPPDVCPPVNGAVLSAFDPNGKLAQQIIRDLVDHHVAITSTLAVFEVAPPIQKRFADALSPQTLANYRKTREALPPATLELSALRVRKEAAFERAFVKAGGLLVAGADPTGNGSALPGFADQRNIELLVEGGFTPLEAVRIATLNGAKLLGLDRQIGSIEPGKQADLVVLKGDPTQRIADIENVELVFKDGVGYDSAKLLASVKGLVGLH